MESRGIHHNPLADISNIRSILKDINNFSIVKELIQNADDADATVISICYHPGFVNVPNTHPLLRAPAVVMVNNGPFDDLHARTICCLGLGTKASDRQAIGRFGCGLKSVFYLCEAFFYTSSAIGNSESIKHFELLNPWKGAHHGDWDHYGESDRDLILETILQLRMKAQWFCLWLPLRRRSFCTDSEGRKIASIFENYPGDDIQQIDLVKSLLRDELSHLPPLLRTLKEIDGWIWEKDKWKLWMSVKLVPGGNSRLFPDPLTGSHRLQGEVETTFTENRDPIKTVFAGVEHWASDAILSSLKVSKRWPKVVGTNEDGFDAGREEKAEPHCAVYFTQRTSYGNGKLTIRWAVFLPVGNDAYDEVEIRGSNQHITMILHGYFFLNSERNNIDGLDSAFRSGNGDSIYHEWNCRLAKSGTLKNVLPALKIFTEGSKKDDESIRKLTTALKASRLYAEFAHLICSHYQWVYCIVPRGSEWRCLLAGDQVYPIPYPRDGNISLPFSVFPSLAKIASEYNITFSGFDAPPMIGLQEPSGWTSAMLDMIFTEVTNDNVSRDEAAEYFLSFIQQNYPSAVNYLGGPLSYVPLFVATSLKTSIRRRYSYSELTELLDRGSLFWSVGDQELAEYLQAACPGLEVVLLPEENREAPFITSLLRSVPQCNLITCCKAVLNCENLGVLHDRMLLTVYMINNGTNVYTDTDKIMLRRAVRYLLHGERLQVDFNETLYITSEATESTTWDRFISLLLQSRTQEWRILDNQFARHIAPVHFSEYLLTRTSAISARELCYDTDLKGLDLSYLTETDHRHIFLELGDDILLRKLPIHLRIGGGLVTLEGLCYLESDFVPEGELLAVWHDLMLSVTVISRSSDPSVLARQKELINELNWDAVIELALKSRSPERYSRAIMTALEKRGTPRQAVGQLLRETPWIPLMTGKVVKPADIIHIDGTESEIHRILNVEDDAICGIFAINDWVWNHPGFNTLKQYFPRPREALEYLGEWLGERDEMVLGLQSMVSVEDLKTFINAFEGCSHSLMSIAPLLVSISKSPAQDILSLCFEKLIPNLLKGAPLERIKDVLLYLSVKHNDAVAEGREVYRKWFDEYLIQAVRSGFIEDILPQISLLNQENKWVPSSRLTWPSEGISKGDQLNNRQAIILENIHNLMVKKTTENFLDTKPVLDKITLEQSANHIGQYFSRFEQWLPRGMIGAVGAILGDYPIIREWSEKMLGDHSIEAIRLEIMPPGHLMEGVDIVGQLNKYLFLCRIVPGETVDVPSLIGDHFPAAVTSNPESLLFGDTFELWRSRQIPGYEKYFCHLIQLLDISHYTDLTQDVAAQLLRRTAELIIFTVYYNRVESARPNLEELWSRLIETGQQDILSAQLFILNNGDFYIKQLGADRSHQLKGNMGKWTRARMIEVDSEVHHRQKQRLKEQGERLRREARDELQELIERNEDIQRLLLKAVQNKMRHYYYYSEESVPFELFQNADDAYQELSMITAGPNKYSEKPLFIVSSKHDVLKFAHWGRRINEYYRDAEFADGKEYGFDRDLQKMLTLSFSDKGDTAAQSIHCEQGSVAGKFGLGFKSVFLVSDSPRIVSGNLDVEVIGGFYPKQLSRDLRISLLEDLRIWRPSKENFGTIIDLPLSLSVESPLSFAMSKFKELIPYQLIFARQIKKCIFYKAISPIEEVSWEEALVRNLPGCFSGRLQHQDGSSNIALILRPQSGSRKVQECALLFTLGVRGFEKLNQRVPSVWITAPTRHHMDVGFAVNGPFEPTVGRSELASHSEINEHLITELANSFGDILIALYDESQKDWKSLCSSLRLAHDTIPQIFWESLWKLMTMQELADALGGPKNSASDLMCALTWACHTQGYHKFIEQRKAAPSGLWEEFQQLVSLREIFCYTTGLLDNFEEIFKRVSTWESFSKLVSQGGCVSGSRMRDLLLKFLRCSNRYSWKKISLSDVLKEEIGENNIVNPDTASLIGSLINKKFMTELASNSKVSPAEIMTLNNFLVTLHFKAQDGRFRPAKELLCGQEIIDVISKEEGLRAAFTPPSRLITAEYNTQGIHLFVTCRGELFAPVLVLSEWAEVAQDEKLQAVFRYLLSGEHWYELSERLKKSWLESRLNSEAFLHLNKSDQDELKWRFRIEMPFIPTGPIQVLPVSDLEVIYKWWMQRKTELMAKYESEVFPSSQPLDFTRNDIEQIETDLSSRKKWIILLMMGSFHTMGRPSSGQHRNFLELFVKKGWLDKLAEPDSSPDALLSILDEYLHDQYCRAEYYEWMKQFISFYQSSKWLSTYVFSISEVDKMHNRFPLRAVFNVRDNSWLSGTGIDAPPLDRAMGIGGCFLVRELIRRGLSHNRFAYEHAYVPSAVTRRILSMLGCRFPDGGVDMTWSSYIHTFLEEKLGKEKATFGLCFDIPFAMIAKDPGLIKDIEIDHIATEEPDDYFTA